MRPDPRLIPRNGVRLLSLCGRSAFVSRSRCDGCKISRLARPESLSACLQIVQMSQKEEEFFFFFFWIPPACPWKVMHPWLTNAVWELMRVARTLMPADRTPTQCLARRRDLLKTRQPPFHRLHSSCPASPFLFSPPFAIFSSFLFTPIRRLAGASPLRFRQVVSSERARASACCQAEVVPLAGKSSVNLICVNALQRRAK